MEYSTKEIADMSGLTVRTLHYYDEINLLKPKRSSNNYRIYNSKDIDKLQRILFYKELGFSLDRVKSILISSGSSFYDELESHLDNLLYKRLKIDNTIAMIKRIQKESTKMNDNEKLEMFKQDQIQNNEDYYGDEIRQNYGDGYMDSFNQDFSNISSENIRSYELISKEIIRLLSNSIKNDDSSHDKNIFGLHQRWLNLINKNYSAEYHKYMAKLYLNDNRFTGYYDSKAGNGAAKKLSSIILYYLK